MMRDCSRRSLLLFSTCLLPVSFTSGQVAHDLILGPDEDPDGLQGLYGLISDSDLRVAGLFKQ